MNILRHYESGILDKELSIKTVLIASLATVAVLSALGNVLLGPNPFYDATTMGITLALCGLLLMALLRGGEVLFPMFALLAAFFLLFIFTRILTFLYFPEWVHLPLTVVLSVKQINYGYAYIAIGSVALCAGLGASRIKN
jgi:general stress protein CsbA